MKHLKLLLAAGAVARPADLILTSAEIKATMRKRGHTIRSIAKAVGITQKRVRLVRESGVRGFLAEEWTHILTGEWPKQGTAEVEA